MIVFSLIVSKDILYSFYFLKIKDVLRNLKNKFTKDFSHKRG